MASMAWRRSVLFLAAGVLAACSDGGAAGGAAGGGTATDGGTSGTGGSGGGAGVVRTVTSDAAFFERVPGIEGGGELLFVGFSDLAGATCENRYRTGSRRLVVAIQSDGAIAPGTFRIPTAAGVTGGPVGADCTLPDDASGWRGASGTFTLESLDAGALSGRIDVTLSDGSRLTGSFRASSCADVALLTCGDEEPGGGGSSDCPDGCLQDGLCLDGSTDDACGTGGGACSVCQGGESCLETKRCGPAPGACTSSTSCAAGEYCDTEISLCSPKLGVYEFCPQGQGQCADGLHCVSGLSGSEQCLAACVDSSSCAADFGETCQTVSGRKVCL
jgi:hypothetical protein